MALSGDQKREYNQQYYQTHRPDRKHILISVRVPSYLTNIIQRIYDESIAKGTWPWKTKSELYIALIRAGLQDLRDHPPAEDAKAYMEARQRVYSLREQRLEAQSLFATIREELDEILAEKKTDVAIQTFHAAVEAAQKMNPTMWRDWLLASLLKAYPELAKAEAKGVAIGKKTKALRLVTE